MVPKFGLTDQLTAVLVAPTTVALKVCDAPGIIVTLAGLTVTTGEADRAIVAFAVTVLSSSLVAITDTSCATLTLSGAV